MLSRPSWGKEQGPASLQPIGGTRNKYFQVISGAVNTCEIGKFQ